MELKFRIDARMARPVAEVFEAVPGPERLSRSLTTGDAKRRLESGATGSWDFADFPGAFPVEVREAVPNEGIVLRWGRDEGAQSRTTVTMSFEPLDGDTRTLVTIAEEGWPRSSRPPAATAWAGRRCSPR